jgi:hypothetical protein
VPSETPGLTHFRFEPNPNFQPDSHEAAVFKSMSGQMWISAQEKRLVRIEGTLFKEVNFGWGILGHLDKGGHFTVAQGRIGPGRWEVTEMDVQFTGRALLFKNISTREYEKYSGFRLVGQSLSLAQGIDLLNRGNALGAQMANGR